MMSTMRASLFVALCFLAACGGDDGSPVQEEGHWQLLGEGRPSSLLAVWSSGVDNVWIVGGREGAGAGPTVLHYDGTAWTKLDTGMVNVDLWQVFGFADGTVFLGGSNGTILRYRNNTFEKLTTPSTDIVFGLWGSSPDDVWAVGGQTTGRPFIWRYQGTAFTSVPGIPAGITTGAVWKVTGRAADDVWMSASQGYVLHWDGQTLSNEMIGGNDESLFSIGCTAELCLTAGTNGSNGVLYENSGAGWSSKVPTEDGPVWRGVTPAGDDPYIVGQFGAVARRGTGKYITEKHALTSESLHSAWVDDDGNLFAVGGKFDRALTIDGVVIFKGTIDLPVLP
ncbi:MAG: hypothetical protein JWP01_1825 [Myxococcales bacterium]|nr:hypothetical protein [Myxococcales bacterium]